MIHSNRLSSLLFTGALATAIVLGVAQPAHATLTSLTVTLSATLPGDLLPSIFSDTVAVIIPPADPDKEIFAGDPNTNIGKAKTSDGSTVLLANEYVNARPTPDAAAANRIVLGLEAGATVEDGPNKGTPITGYSTDAYYSFSNFVFSTPSIVTGVNVSPMNIQGLGMLNALGSQITFTDGVIKVLIGNLFICEPPGCTPPAGVALGTITMDLTVQAVPEPGTFALIGVGLVLVAVGGRMRRRS